MRRLDWTAVVRVLVGAAADAVQARDVCAVQGVQVGCFRPPSVPDGGTRTATGGR